MIDKKKILLVWYGDDFTGSTDALEFIARAGARVMLFLETPTAGDLQAYPGLQAFGIAGHTRALHPNEMEPILMDAFQKVAVINPLFVHYKVCSTFDSSANVGSIGKALDCGLKVYENKLVPILGGMPLLGRYCAFGNLFAKMGTGGGSQVYRIDRHPSMSHHPVTPSKESDLRLHIGEQTNQPIGLIDYTKFENPVELWQNGITEDEGAAIVDCTEADQLKKIGKWLGYLQASSGRPQFCIGGSGIEAALGHFAASNNLFSPQTDWPSPHRAERMLVISGSCSPVTAKQIEWAKAHGFAEYILDSALYEVGQDDSNVEDAIVSLVLSSGYVIVHTGGRRGEWIPAERLGHQLGSIALAVLKRIKIDRLVIAGGDTSSYAARALQIDAVEMLAPIVPGAPLCKAYSKEERVNGLEVSIKGGQVGDADFFGVLVGGIMNDE